ncbi:hypothetical protein ACIBBD_25985 [Streptomyces sp. NPDC051315]|uniref:hypothetical protein n=1 Tax=Streptomyces sp. NPDC051315 TaxID=3365650 RepID=UPI0037B8345A
MNPQTYATLYGAWQPTGRPGGRGRAAAAVAAGVLWALTLVSLAWLTVLVGMVAVWGLAEGVPVGGFVLRYALVVVGAMAVLIALAHAPGVRRLSPAVRLLVLAVPAFPVPTALAVWTWCDVG